MTKKISSFLLYVTVLLLATSLISAPVQSPLNPLLPPVAAHHGPTISEYGTPSVSPAQAVPGDVIVSDPSANTLFVQSNCASPPCAAPTPLFSGTPYVTPEGVAMDSSGNIIVADGSGKIFRQSPSGSPPTLLYSGSPYMSPAGVAIDSSGNIIVADLGAKTIFRQSNCASPPCAAPTIISSIGYHYPFGVAVDSSGNIVVADGSGTIFRQNPAGGAPTPISATGYMTPQGVTIDFSGNIIVTDYGVRAIFRQSNCATPPCAPPTAISVTGYVTPEGVAMDSLGNFIVADQGGSSGSPAILRQSMSGGAPSTLFSGTPYVSPEFDVVLKPLKTAGGCEMAITKTITPNQVQSGGTATVTLTLTPTSSADCNGNDPVYISFIDSMPTGLVAYQPVSVAGAYGMNCDVTYGGGIVSCGIYIPTLIPYPSQSATVTFNVQVTAPAGSTIGNCAIVYVQDQHNQFFNSNVGCATLTVVGDANGCDLAIAKTMNVSSDGLTITINLNVSNQGPGVCTLDNLLAFTVNDTMPIGLTATSTGGVGWTCNLVVICHPSSGGSFPPGWSGTIAITAKVTGGAGKIENCAHVIYELDANQSNNVSCASSTVEPTSGCDLKITKTISPAPGYPNVHTITLTIVNVGSMVCGADTANQTVVTDNLPLGMIKDSTPGSSVNCGTPGSGWNCQIMGLGWFCQISNSGSTVICKPDISVPYGNDFSSIPPNIALTITIPVIVTGQPGDTLTNCATVSNPGDHNPANDQSCATFTIPRGTSTTSTSQPSCIIATAAYGSELAAPVQFLRSFRDNEVQKTALGSAFLQAFNGWYYSWAPSVAQQIAPNENYKSATRAVIAPLIGSLFLGHAVFAAMAPLSPELAIVSAGLLASSLIGAFYLGLPLAVLRTRIRRLGGLKVQRSLQRILTGALLTALGLMLVGGIIPSTPILILSTSTFVLSTLFLSAAITSGTIAKRITAEK